MISKNTIRLLRIPFSFYLMPVFFFALSQSVDVRPLSALAIFLILHLLVYPSSNGYNSYMDRDEKSIGGLRNPPQPTEELFYITLIMDITSVFLSYLIEESLAAMILIYILVSRAYSYRKIRLKKYPLTGFLTVVIFQGAFTYFAICSSISAVSFTDLYLPMAVTSCLIAANYPLTQIYQHTDDRKDGVMTISMMLGYRGTFLLSGIFFLISGILMYIYFSHSGRIFDFILFGIFSLPVIVLFLLWFDKVMRNEKNASFDNAMRMNNAGALTLISYFTLLIVMNRDQIF